MADQIFIQRRFTISDPYGTFNDAIVLLQTDYDLLTQKQIDDTKTARLVSWKKAIDDAKLIPLPTKTEQIAKIDIQLTELNVQITALTAQKGELQK